MSAVPPATLDRSSRRVGEERARRDVADADPSLPARRRLTVLESSLATTDLDGLEALHAALSPPRWSEVFQGTPSIGELAVLRTCHRLEAYCWADEPVELLSRLGAAAGDASRWRSITDEGAVHHLFRVASGLESTAVGEQEVRGQVRAAAAHVLSRTPRPVLRPLFLRSVEAAEAAAPKVPANRSIAAIAAARVIDEVPQPFPRVVVVGTGVVGRTVAEQLAPYGRVTIVYRSRSPEAEYLRSIDARAVPWANLEEELEWADVAVTAVKTGGRIIDAGSVRHRSRPLLIVDLGLPRNVDPSVRHQPGIRLVDLEGLRAGAKPATLDGIEATVARLAREVFAEVDAAGYEPWVDAFRRAGEETRVRLVEEARASLGSLEPHQRAAIDRLTVRLVASLLDNPTRRLREIPPGPAGSERRRWAAELLGIGSRRP